MGDNKPPDVGERDERTSCGLLDAKSVVMTVMDGILWSSSTLDMLKVGGKVKQCYNCEVVNSPRQGLAAHSLLDLDQPIPNWSRLNFTP